MPLAVVETMTPNRVDGYARSQYDAVSSDDHDGTASAGASGCCMAWRSGISKQSRSIKSQRRQASKERTEPGTVLGGPAAVHGPSRLKSASYGKSRHGEKPKAMQLHSSDAAAAVAATSLASRNATSQPASQGRPQAVAISRTLSSTSNNSASAEVWQQQAELDHESTLTPSTGSSPSRPTAGVLGCISMSPLHAIAQKQCRAPLTRRSRHNKSSELPQVNIYRATFAASSSSPSASTSESTIPSPTVIESSLRSISSSKASATSSLSSTPLAAPMPGASFSTLNVGGSSASQNQMSGPPQQIVSTLLENRYLSFSRSMSCTAPPATVPDSVEEPEESYKSKDLDGRPCLPVRGVPVEFLPGPVTNSPADGPSPSGPESGVLSEHSGRERLGSDCCRCTPSRDGETRVPVPAAESESETNLNAPAPLPPQVPLAVSTAESQSADGCSTGTSSLVSSLRGTGRPPRIIKPLVPLEVAIPAEDESFTGAGSGSGAMVTPCSTPGGGARASRQCSVDSREAPPAPSSPPSPSSPLSLAYRPSPPTATATANGTSRVVDPAAPSRGMTLPRASTCRAQQHISIFTAASTPQGQVMERPVLRRPASLSARHRHVPSMFDDGGRGAFSGRITIQGSGTYPAVSPPACHPTYSPTAAAATVQYLPSFAERRAAVEKAARERETVREPGTLAGGDACGNQHDGGTAGGPMGAQASATSRHRELRARRAFRRATSEGGDGAIASMSFQSSVRTPPIPHISENAGADVATPEWQLQCAELIAREGSMEAVGDRGIVNVPRQANLAPAWATDSSHQAVDVPNGSGTSNSGRRRQRVLRKATTCIESPSGLPQAGSVLQAGSLGRRSGRRLRSHVRFARTEDDRTSAGSAHAPLNGLDGSALLLLDASPAHCQSPVRGLETTPEQQWPVPPSQDLHLHQQHHQYHQQLRISPLKSPAQQIRMLSRGGTGIPGEGKTRPLTLRSATAKPPIADGPRQLSSPGAKTASEIPFLPACSSAEAILASWGSLKGKQLPPMDRPQTAHATYAGVEASDAPSLCGRQVAGFDLVKGKLPAARSLGSVAGSKLLGDSAAAESEGRLTWSICLRHKNHLHMEL